MPMKQWGNAYRTTVVCVDSYDEHVLRGRLYNPHRPEGIAFRSVMEFLLRMEDLLDDMHFPQSFSAVRSFGAPPERTAASPPAAERQLAGLPHLVGRGKGGELPKRSGAAAADAQRIGPGDPMTKT